MEVEREQKNAQNYFKYVQKTTSFAVSLQKMRTEEQREKKRCYFSWVFVPLTGTNNFLAAFAVAPAKRKTQNKSANKMIVFSLIILV